MENTTKSGISSSAVRSELDNILNEHIERLSKTTTAVSTLEMDLITIACMQLMVEREEEIKIDDKLERYTRETFLKDLTDIGLEMDDELMGVFQILVMYNYVEMKDNCYNPRKAAFEQVKYLDKMFPGMPGMNLVAYFLQMIEEVTSDRKSFEEAKEHFDQTLHKRSKGVYRNQYKQVALESSVSLKKKKASNEAKLLKKNFKNKLSKLRGSKKKAGSSIYAQSEYAAKHVKIKELFTEEDEFEQVEKNNLDKIDPEIEQDEKAEDVVIDNEEKEKLEEEEKKLLEEFKAREDELIKRIEELENKTVEEKTIGDLEEERKNEPEPEPEPEPELTVEERIAAFEREMAMTCPLCGAGKITESATEKGQTYHSCTNKGCQFISWSKPYQFDCPKCKNNFLIESVGDDGEPGLKCPKSSCTYKQNSLSAPEDLAPKKKKRVVVRRRKKR
ncbi:MAG: hypothetical protein GY714_05285 [Desulfobacterales bacterium]|nr:hypothetical protein [Desulfobacterales bacterium]